MKLIRIFAPLFILFGIIACNGDDSPKPEETLFEIQGENGFVGTVDGTDAFIALLVANNEAIVYVCNGEEEISEWFKDNISDPEKINLKNSSGAQVIANFVGSSFTGSLTLSNTDTHSFMATPNTGDEIGIFNVYGDLATLEGIATGWILNAKGDERGSFRFKSVFQATPPKPKTGSVFFFNQKNFPIQRFSSYHPDSLTVVR